MAGNLWEWTEETSYYGGNTSTQYRMLRGGGEYIASSTHPVCYRAGGGNLTYTGFHMGFRVVLYMK